MKIWVMSGGESGDPNRTIWVRMSDAVGLYREENNAKMVGYVYTPQEAARLLAGLEVAMGKALAKQRVAKCIRCGATEDYRDFTPHVMPEDIRCTMCGGILSPGQGAGEK